jgi:hypothetical protein
MLSFWISLGPSADWLRIKEYILFKVLKKKCGCNWAFNNWISVFAFSCSKAIFSSSLRYQLFNTRIAINNMQLTRGPLVVKFSRLLQRPNKYLLKG